VAAGDQHSVTLQGIELPYVRKGSGRTLVMLHGGGGPVAAMPFADLLAERFDVVAPIHPGFAGTEIPEHFDNIHDLKFLYLDFMDALGIRDAVLMGFSMGGWAAAEIAVMTTERLSKLILVDAVGIKPGDRERRDIPDVFATPPPELVKLTWHDPAKAPDLGALDDAGLAMVAANRVALALYTWDPYMHNPKLPGLLHRVRIPTLLIWGASDRLVTPAYGEAYLRLLPDARLVVIPEAGHAPQAEQPRAFVEHVRAFAA